MHGRDVVLSSTDVFRLIAHRYPMLLVDTVEVVEPGRRAIGTMRVTADAATGSRDRAAVPGLLAVEALAQTASAVLMGIVDTAEGAVGYFAGFRRVRLRHAPEPGDTLTLDVELQSFRRGIARLKGIATVGNRLVAAAEFTTVVRAAAASGSGIVISR